jgi:epoxyqueuosine reductase
MTSGDSASLSGKDLAAVLTQAQRLGATLAGGVPLPRLESAPAYQTSGKAVGLPPSGSVLVLGLAHPESAPQLDWWGGTGGTPGNRALGRLGEQLVAWLTADRGVEARVLPYHVERGGVFLKDAAVLAGLGVMGRNNLVITPRFGPRLRWRGLWVAADIQAPDSLDASPCDECARPCFEACPQEAFRSGGYERRFCDRQMKADEAAPVTRRADQADLDLPPKYVRYCRECEWACPVGQD